MSTLFSGIDPKVDGIEYLQASTRVDLESKESKEKQERGWVLKFGGSQELRTLLSDKDSNDCVIYEKSLTVGEKQAEKAVILSELRRERPDSYFPLFEKFNLPQTVRAKARQIIACRVKRTPETFAGRGALESDRPFTIFILCSNKEISTVDTSTSGASREITWTNLRDESYLMVSIMEKDYHDGYVASKFPANEGIVEGVEIDQEKKVALFLRAYLSQGPFLPTHSFLGFTPGEMSKRKLDIFLKNLQLLEILTEKDCQFIKKTFPHRKIPNEDMLEARIQAALTDKRYGEAIEVAKEMHGASRKQAVEKGLKCSINFLPAVEFIDDCDVAWELGEALEKVGALREAIAAFKILTDYENSPQAGQPSFTSPHTMKAQKKILTIYTRLIDFMGDAEDAKSKAEKRRLEEEALKIAFWLLAMADDKDSSSTLKTTVLTLLESLCGSASTDRQLFSHIDCSSGKASEINFLDFLTHTMLSMASELHGHRQAMRISVGTSSSVVKSRETKEEAEKQGQAAAVGQAAVPAHKPVEGILAEKPASLALTLLRDSQMQQEQQLRQEREKVGSAAAAPGASVLGSSRK